jgi:hypothetical protein
MLPLCYDMLWYLMKSKWKEKRKWLYECVIRYYGGSIVTWGFSCIMGVLLYLGWLLGGFYCILGVWWCLLGASFVFWVSCGFWELWVCSSLWVFLSFFCGLAELSLCISCVLRAALHFFNEIFLLIKKKCEMSFKLFLVVWNDVRWYRS